MLQIYSHAKNKGKTKLNPIKNILFATPIRIFFIRSAFLRLDLHLGSNHSTYLIDAVTIIHLWFLLQQQFISIDLLIQHIQKFVEQNTPKKNNISLKQTKIQLIQIFAVDGTKFSILFHYSNFFIMNNISIDINSRKFNNMFEFPFQPYPCQVSLATEIYQCCENKNIGIFESPTGTGKSMTIIASAFQWLIDNKLNIEKNYEALKKQKTDELNTAFPEWFSEASSNREKQELISKMELFYKEIEDLISKPAPNERNLNFFNRIKNQHQTSVSQQEYEHEDKDLIITCSDDEEDSKIEKTLKKNKMANDSIPTNVTLNLNSENFSDFNQMRVIYCSRTHTQIQQFMEEIKKTKFAKILKIVSLGSRSTFCINSAVNLYGVSSIINDHCQKLRDRKKCPYYKDESADRLSIEMLKEIFISSEEKLKEFSKTCPYYSKRRASKYADVLCLPYQCIMHQETRESLKINLNNSIVIFDEAHNVSDLIYQMSSVSIQLKDLKDISICLQGYISKYSSMLKARSSLRLNQLTNIIKKLISFLATTSAQENNKKLNYVSLKFGDIYSVTQLDQIDLYGLKKFLQDSKLGYKINFFKKKEQNDQAANLKLDLLIQFMLTFVVSKPNNSRLVCILNSNPDETGLMIVSLKNQMLQQILEESRCCIFIGGTLQPISLLTSFIASPKLKSKIQVYSCNHIISETQLTLFPISVVNKINLRFTYENRENQKMFDSLLILVQEMVKVVSGGKVIFFPSYKMLNYFQSLLKKDNFFDGHKIFCDNPKIQKAQNNVFRDYSAFIKENGNAMLFTVMGGKLSEGINFSDESRSFKSNFQLARIVFLVGLPYPSTKSPDILERMKYFDSFEGKAENDGITGNDFYENLCMKTVNQTIGRAIRHSKDYGAVFLIDERFKQIKIQNKLSNWVKPYIRAKEEFNLKELAEILNNFFKINKEIFQN